MSDRSYAPIDNQFVAIRPVTVRPLSRPAPIFRKDYSSSLINFRTPSPPTRYIDGFSAKRPANRSKPHDPVRVKQHQTHAPLLNQEFFQNVFEASAPAAQPKKYARRLSLKLPKLNKVQLAILSLAVVFLAAGSYFTIIGWHSSLVAKRQAINLTKIADGVKAGAKNPALSTTPISASTLASYAVAPNLPRYLIIPKLRVDARVLSVGVTNSGALATPNNVFDTAWYNESAEPGQPGATLIDGHVSSWTAHGVFYGIKTLVAGDTIQIERGDGAMFTYKVVKSQVYPSGNVDMQSAMTPVVAGQSGLNLITCTGDVIPGTSTFNERIIVFATLVS